MIKLCSSFSCLPLLSGKRPRFLLVTIITVGRAGFWSAAINSISPSIYRRTPDMAGRRIFNPDSFKNVESGKKAVGFEFEFKLQYYRSITLSIIRDIKVNVDGEDIPRENIRLTVKGETFTLNETRTVIDSNIRWEFGDDAKVTCLKEGGLCPGRHHISAVQHIAPSYMPFPVIANAETDFTL